jgi:MFS family permease
MRETSVRKLLILFCSLFTLLALPSPAFAHGGGDHEASVIAGPLSWGFLTFGVIVISAVFFVLLSSPRQRKVTKTDFEQLTGFGGYLAKIRLFSRNARLYMVHVVGMDMIYGTWLVMFNLYLLAAGFDVAFVGLRLLLGSITSAIFSIPAGLISDRIGRKLSFILGDGVGAAMSLIAISTKDPALLLVTAVIGGALGALHGVAEPAFMAENSENYERVHLFSVSDGTRTAAAMIGSALAGLVPFLFMGADAASKIGLYRAVAYIGIGGWFASLIPAILLQQTTSPQRTQPETRNPKLLRQLFGNIKHPALIWRLTLPEICIALGAGFALPLMNVFFKKNLGSPEVEIGATFAAGEAFLVVGSFLAPLLAARVGKVKSIAFTRLASIPFILLIAFSPDVGAAFGSVLTIAGLAYVARTALMNMSGPIRSAFGMEILDPAERGTQVGIQQALSAALTGAASFFGARLMSAGDFHTSFFIMAGCYLLATVLFWNFFAGREKQLAPVAEAVAGD